jgi:Ran-binding protein 1
MSSTDATEPKVEETKPAETTSTTGALENKAEEVKSAVTSSSVFSMFGGGAKKEKKDDEEDRGDNSGSAKAQRDAAAAAKGDDEVCIYKLLCLTRSSCLVSRTIFLCSSCMVRINEC